MTVGQFIFYTVWAIGCMLASSILQHLSVLWIMQHRRFKCAQCEQKKPIHEGIFVTSGKRVCMGCASSTVYPAPSMSPVLDDIKLKATEATPNLAAEFAKQLLKDPEALRAYRKIIGIQSEREKFEEESETGHDDDDLPKLEPDTYDPDKGFLYR